MKAKSGNSAKILTAAISALMLISLISVFQVGTASAQEEPELVGSFSRTYQTTTTSTDFYLAIGLAPSNWYWFTPPWPPEAEPILIEGPNPSIASASTYDLFQGMTDGAFLFEDIQFGSSSKGQTYTISSVSDDTNFDDFAAFLTNSTNDQIWEAWIWPMDPVNAGGMRCADEDPDYPTDPFFHESHVFSGTDVGTDYPGWVIQRISLTFDDIYTTPSGDFDYLTMEYTVDIYAGPWITLSPDEGISVTTLVGQGFTPGAGITYAWDGEPIEMGATEVGSDGSVYAIIAVQTQGTPGVHLVTATDAEGISASATFEVLNMKGDKGAPGDDGEDGEDGALGLTGPQGAQGPTGAKGDTGDVGSQGSTGSQGPQGETGAMGPKGSAGEDTQAGIAWMSMVAAIIALLVAAYAVARR